MVQNKFSRKLQPKKRPQLNQLLKKKPNPKLHKRLQLKLSLKKPKLKKNPRLKNRPLPKEEMNSPNQLRYPRIFSLVTFLKGGDDATPAPVEEEKPAEPAEDAPAPANDEEA